MRLNKLILAFFVLFSLSSLSQKKECNCSQYYTGTFYILNDAMPGDTCFIKRTATSQNEWIPNKINETFDVIWVNKCTYVLRNHKLHTTKKYHPSDVISKIIETGRTYYKVKAWAPRGKKSIFTVHVYNP